MNKETKEGLSMSLENFERYCEVNGNFMQSVNWAKVKNSWNAEYIEVCDKSGNIEGTMLVLVKKIPFLKTAMLYAPRGPVCDMHNKGVLERIFEKLCEIAKKYNAYMLKIDPLIDERDIFAISNLKSLGFEYHPERVGYDNVQCRENYILDISGKSTDEVFAGFKSKWRYNIRLAQRKGVVCDFYEDDKLDDFEALMKQTSVRDGFDMRSKEYFRNLLKSFDGKAKLCMCYADGVALSGALCIEYAGTMSYVYGCSSNEMRNYMPNYLMQWTMIKSAVEDGCHTYDFCGIPYWYDMEHKNFGVYKFKQGFNGQVKVWAGEFDYVFRAGLKRCADIMMQIKGLSAKISAGNSA